MATMTSPNVKATIGDVEWSLRAHTADLGAPDALVPMSSPQSALPAAFDLFASPNEYSHDAGGAHALAPTALPLPTIFEDVPCFYEEHLVEQSTARAQPLASTGSHARADVGFDAAAHSTLPKKPCRTRARAGVIGGVALVVGGCATLCAAPPLHSGGDALAVASQDVAHDNISFVEGWSTPSSMSVPNANSFGKPCALPKSWQQGGRSTSAKSKRVADADDLDLNPALHGAYELIASRGWLHDELWQLAAKAFFAELEEKEAERQLRMDLDSSRFTSDYHNLGADQDFKAYHADEPVEVLFRHTIVDVITLLQLVACKCWLRVVRRLKGPGERTRNAAIMLASVAAASRGDLIGTQPFRRRHYWY